MDFILILICILLFSSIIVLSYELIFEIETRDTSSESLIVILFHLSYSRYKNLILSLTPSGSSRIMLHFKLQLFILKPF